MPLRNVLLRGMLWSLAFAAATGVLAVLFQAGSLVWRVVGTGFTTALACGLMLPVSGMIDREKSRSAGLLGMGAVIAEFLMALALIWEVPQNVFGLSWEVEIGYSMLTLGLAVVMIMCLLQLDRELSRPAGLLGTGGVIAESLMALALIWEAPQQVFGVSLRDEIGLTMLILGLAVVMIVYLLQLKHAPYGLFAGRVGLYVTLATFVAFMIATWGPSRVFNDEK